MGRLPVFAFIAFTIFSEANSNGSGEFKRMPEIRGQSFGLENFLMQPFNLASAVEAPAPTRGSKRTHDTNSYSVEYQVPNKEEFDMRRLVPTLPGASMVFNQAEPHRDHKPVHEEIEEAPPPPRRRPLKRKPHPSEELEMSGPRKRIPQVEKMPTLEEEIQALVPTPFQTHRERQPSLEEEIQSLVPRKRLPDIRRPLEKPAEFMVSITEHAEPFPSPLEEVRPHRKRVMKRRRKKPNPAPVENNDDEKLIQETPVKEIEDNLYGNMPTSYQETVKDTTGAESIVIEHGTRRKHGQKRKEPIYTEGLSHYEDKLLSEATQTVPQKEIIQSIPEGRPYPTDPFSAPDPPRTPTTDQPESTQRLKTLLKQQNGQLSLSELLQTQNLSLADFLKGNPGALSALGGTKVKPAETTLAPEEKPKERQNIPKISPKSRPFSKPFNGTKPILRRTTTTTTTEEPTEELPKKLQIIEVTSDKPTYNGFAPKRPRIRIGPKDKFNFSRERTEEPTSERTTTEAKEPEEEQDNEIQTTRQSPRVHKITTESPAEISSTEGRKRFGEYRPKIKIDRRKPQGESPTEGTEMADAKEQMVISTTEEMKTKELRNRVRIPFMSVNNPEISVILPSKKPNTTTEKPRPSPVIKDRINVFKRLNSEEKVTNENSVDSQEKGTEQPEGIFLTKPLSTTTLTPVTQKTTTEDQMTGDETSDEIIELLKTGNNAQRLQRILAVRNMTVSELVDKRANSSKHPNVTKLFEQPEGKQSRNRATERNDDIHPSTERSRGVHTTKRILPVFDILSPNYKTDNNEKIRIKSEIVKPPETNSFDELFVDESVVRPIKLPAEETREPKYYEINKDAKQNRLHLPAGIEGKPKTPVPLWNVEDKPIYGSYPTYEMNKNLAGKALEPTKVIEEDLLISETVDTDTESRLQSSINDILKEQVNVKDVKEDIAIIPPAVKSAIIASGVVMGIALLVFVAIFAACGWKQRQFRLRARSSILNDSIDGSARKAIRRTGTLSPVSFKRSALYKKSIDFDTESSVSGSSNTSSYLWNTLKHTFQSRNSTLKNREEKEEKIQERENRSRRNTLHRDEERPRRGTLTRDMDMPRRNTLTREDLRRDSVMSRDTLSRDTPRDSLARDSQRDSLARETQASRDLIRTESRRSSCFRDERRLNNIMRDNERCSFRSIDPDRQIIQTSVNFKRGGFNGSRHFDSTCDHFN